MKGMRLIPLAAAFGLMVVSACNEPGPSNGSNDKTPGSYDGKALLQDLSANVIAPAYADAATAAAALKTAVEGYAEATEGASANTDQALADARAAWKQAMLLWQRAEVYQVGPAAPAGSDAGGEGLRDEVYSWRTVNPCRVDQELVSGDYKKTDFTQSELVNVYGLDALEYLLFHEGDNNQCPEQSNINTTGDWSSIQDELPQRRADYASVVAADIARQTQILADAWDSAGGNFGAKLAGAGVGDSPYASEDEALQAMLGAIFYIELFTKDEKIGIPAARVPGCSQDSCPADMEHQWADIAKASVLSNLEAAMLMLDGGNEVDGYGFVDAVRDAAGDAETGALLQARLATAIETVQGFEGSFLTQLQADATALDGIYDALKAFTDILRTDAVTLLTLQVPQEGAGDTD